jgi:hypothetical protein
MANPKTSVRALRQAQGERKGVARAGFDRLSPNGERVNAIHPPFALSLSKGPCRRTPRLQKTQCWQMHLERH